MTTRYDLMLNYAKDIEKLAEAAWLRKELSDNDYHDILTELNVLREIIRKKRVEVLVGAK